MAKTRTTRDKMKEKLKQADSHITTSLELLAEVWQVYQEPHPDIAEYISIIMEGLDTAQSTLNDLNRTI